MSPASRSVFVFGLYLFGAAALLMIAPNVLLGLLLMEPTTDPWIRVLGVVVAVLGAYYVVAARAELIAFHRTTVPARAFALLAFVALAALGLAPVQLVGFGVVDGLGALWTWTALRAR